MDALDEFFCQWAEPEAWCQRCREYPAMHVAVQDKAAPEALLITYVRVFDATIQEHIALCRRCSREAGPDAEKLPYQYLPTVRYNTPRRRWDKNLLSTPPQWWQRVATWARSLLRRWRNAPGAPGSAPSKRYTGQSSNG